MTSVLPSAESATPPLPDAGLDSTLVHDDERHLTARAAAYARQAPPPMDVDAVTSNYQDITTELQFEVDRAAWIMAKRAVRLSSELGGEPLDYIGNEDIERNVLKQKAASFLGAALEAYTLSQQPSEVTTSAG